ncbi:hypothetical protein [Lacinutrix sp. 5H-3-7-4]|uniref:hypothetical protein n=1 Tax=Lacinutrix sp. (strain 5H-3-7-4) TaxID=983544 RepID=UPI00020A371E|nr:hypothetical protein [Lacinutrix sp. 5H-3-7-4]AEH00825.1 hypothetical protein Lacal_0977 [Lacinutrix sp. 5H-3-7-4]
MFLAPNMNLDGFIAIIILIMVGPAILFFIIASILTVKKKKKVSKVFWILGVVYLIISFGVCGALIASN